MILRSEHTRDNDVWEQSAQIRAGLARRKMEVLRPEGTSPAERQAALVREAAARGSVVLIVEPEDPKLLTPALEEAREKGVPMVLLERSVPVSGRPLPIVEYASLKKATKEMVDAVLAAARKAGGPADPPVRLVLPAGADDPRMLACQETVKAVLGETRCTMLPDLVLPAGSNPEPRFRAALQQKPRPSALFILDDNLLSPFSMNWAAEQVNGLPVFGGYMADRTKIANIAYGGCVALVNLDLARFGETAVDTAMALSVGETVPEHIIVPLEVRLGDMSRRLAVPKLKPQFGPAPELEPGKESK
jgi:ABC-type sugar transport system substrate-binding protein